MNAYRIYLLTPLDRIDDELEASFETDRAALARAEEKLAGGYAAEVWQGERLVARLGGALALARG